jgi:hypothetical protein
MFDLAALVPPRIDEAFKARRKNCREKKKDRKCVAVKTWDKERVFEKYEFNFYECEEKKWFICEIPGKFIDPRRRG